MTQEDKELLLRDLSARLPYRVICKRYENAYELVDIDIKRGLVYLLRDEQYVPYSITSGDEIKPYLRPMSSITEEEFVYFMGLRGRMLQSYEIQSMMKETFNTSQIIGFATTLGSYSNKIDWLNKNHFDYRGLIPRRLAIEVTENNNPYED